MRLNRRLDGLAGIGRFSPQNGAFALAELAALAAVATLARLAISAAPRFVRTGRRDPRELLSVRENGRISEIYRLAQTEAAASALADRS